jgi:serine/threonine protein kinase
MYLLKHKKYKNKSNDMFILLKQYGGKNMFDKMIIIRELGKGNFGKTYLIEINNKQYALKKQNITEKDYLSNSSDMTIFLNNELDFYNWINKLNDDDKQFFMEMYEYNRYESNGKYYQDTIVSLKNGTIFSIINELNRNEIISIFIQIVYALDIMHKNGFYHCDSKSDNIGYVNTKEKYINVGTNKVKSFGKVASLLDYGSVISKKNIGIIDTKYDEQLKVSEMYNIDLWLLIDYLLLNNGYVYLQLGNLGFLVENIIKIINLLDDKIIDEILLTMKKDFMFPNIEFFSDFIHNRKNIAGKIKNKVHKTLCYEFLQILCILHYDIFIGLLEKVFKVSIIPYDQLFTRDELLFVKKSYMDMQKIIDVFLKF